MANTYSQINIHGVFAVKGRDNCITRNFRDDLHKYISGILKNDGSFPLAVGGWLDHVHVFFELPVTMKVSDQMSRIKSGSSLWINENKLVKGKFQWQEGYGAFSNSRTQRDPVIKYIINQERHHRSKTFREEYLELLAKFEIEYKEKYLFEFYDWKPGIDGAAK
ncbi:MAG: transposase [Chitinophagales bacterium]